MKPVSMRDLAVAVNKVLAVENGKEK